MPGQSQKPVDDLIRSGFSRRQAKVMGGSLATPDGVLVYKGAWDAVTAFKKNDVVTLSSAMWVATADNNNVQPSATTVNNAAGGDGGPGNYDLSQMGFGGNTEVAHPIRVSRSLLLGGITMYSKAGTAITGKIGIAFVKPTGNQLSLVVPGADFSMSAGVGSKTLLLDTPVQLSAGQDYYVWIQSTSNIATLTGQLPGGWAYSGAGVAPSSLQDLARTSGGNWVAWDNHTYVGLLERDPVVWQKLADVTTPANSTNKVSSVTAVTGSEARPNANLVIWDGGTVAPTNMALRDIWVKTDGTVVVKTT